MENKTIFDKFTKQYQLSKTLRFELVPVGETERFIKEKGLLQQDETRAEDYKVVKKLIDEYHKEFIEGALQKFLFNTEKLQRHEELFMNPNREATEKDEFKELKADLRKSISLRFTKDNKAKYDPLDKKLLFREETDKETGEITGNIIPAFYEQNKAKVLQNLQRQLSNLNLSDEKLKTVIEDFKSIFTYLQPFCENRKKILYTDKAIKNTIPYRLVDENLPIFSNNKRYYEKIKNALGEKILQEVEKNLKITFIDDFFKLTNFNSTLTQTGIDQYNKAISGVKKSGKIQFKGLNQHIKEYNDIQKDKAHRIPKLKKLFKQILGDRDSDSFRYEPFERDKQVLAEVKEFYEKTLCNNTEIEDTITVNILCQIKDLLEQLKNYDLKKIYVRAGNSLTLISTKIFGNQNIEDEWSIINKALISYYDKDNIPNSPKSTLKEIISGLETKSAERRSTKDKGIKDKLKKEIDKLKRLKERYEGYIADMDKWLNDQEYFSVADVEAALNQFEIDDQKIRVRITEHTLCDYFAKAEKGNGVHLFDLITEEYNAVKELLDKDIKDDALLERPKSNDSGDDNGNDNSEVTRIKRLLDSIKDLLHFIKPLYIGEEPLDSDSGFYNCFDELHDQLCMISSLYDKTRNRLTQKPFSTDKIRLIFDKGNLLKGWVESKGESATQYGGYLLRKENKEYKELTGETEYDYYLGVSKDSQLFSCDWTNNNSDKNKSGDGEFERLNYYQLNPQTENSVLKKFLIQFAENNGDLVIKIKKHLEEKGASADTCAKSLSDDLQSHFENLLKEKKFSLGAYEIARDNPKIKLYGNKEYKRFQDLFDDIQKKEFKYYHVSKEDMKNALIGKKNKKEDLVDSHPLLLFKITSKDLSYAENAAKDFNGNEKRKKWRESRGTENLHTMYFRHLMSGNQNVIDLGTGMVFWRKESDAVKKEPTHKKGEEIKKKNPNVPLTEEGSKFDYDLTKDKRYTKDKYFFHLSTIINYRGEEQPKQKYIYGWNEKFNKQVRGFLRDENDELNIIGIDRGERHLLYVTVINRQGEIIQKLEVAPNGRGQFSLNEIISRYKTKEGEREIVTPYHKILKIKGDRRTKARKSWGVVENIKELKEGYLSQVVHQISKMVIQDGKVKAVIVMEALNPGFKRGRQKVESQVYQKFEKMLIEKLNYLVFKDEYPHEKGGVLNGWQLTGKYDIRSLEGLKQSGIIFYIPAAYTSQIDPATGFVNFFNSLPYGNISKSQKFFRDFESIIFNQNRFEFKFDYSKFPENAPKAVGKMIWTACTTPEKRYRWNKYKPNTNGKGGYDEYDVTEELKTLFKGSGISDYEGLREKIIKQDDVVFFNKLLKLFSVTLTLRHNNGLKGDAEEDHIISPVYDDVGNRFFKTSEDSETDPKNADANGAYHIALKGLLSLRRIRGNKDVEKFDNKGNIDLSISNEEWLNFAQMLASTK